MKPITKKRRSISLFREGIFGNTLNSWSADEFISDAPTGLFSVRQLDSLGGSGICETDQTHKQVLAILDDLSKSGKDLGNYHTHESIDNSRMIMQGYLWDSPEGFVFDYSTKECPMREALEEEMQSLSSKMLPECITVSMSPRALRDLRFALEVWPEHVYEMTILDRPFGLSLNNNAIIWEVRQY